MPIWRPRSRARAPARTRHGKASSYLPPDLARLDWLLDALQLERLEAGDRTASRLQRLARHQDRVRSSRGAQPGCAMHRHPAQRGGVRRADLADVDADPHLRRVAVEPAVRVEPALDGDRTVDRVARGVEHDEEAIARVVDLAPTALLERAPHLAVQPDAEVCPRRVADGLDQARRAGEVGEHQRLARALRLRALR